MSVDWCFCIPYSHKILQDVIAIIALAAPGCLLRIVLTEFTHHYLYQRSPVDIAPSVTTNLIGCFIMGFHEGFIPSRSDKYVKAGIATGFAGSVTTFSSFNFEINQFIVDNKPNIASYVVSIAITFIGGIFLYFLGEFISLRIFKKRKEHKLLKKNDEYINDDDMELDEIKCSEQKIIQNILQQNNFFEDDDAESDDFIHLFESFVEEKNTQICLKDAICEGFSYPNDEKSKWNELLIKDLKYLPSKIYNFHSILLFNYLKIDDFNQENVINVVSKIIQNHKYKQQITKNVYDQQINGEKLKKIIIEKDIHCLFDEVEISESEWNKLNEFVSKNKENKEENGECEDLSNHRSICQNDGFIFSFWIFLLVVSYTFCISVSFLLNDRVWEAMLLSPIGAITRWYLGKVFNGHKQSPIPLGTFIANIFGSLLFTILHRLSDDRGDVWYKYYEFGLAGILEGYCGCLTTISSFVHEKVSLKRKAAKEKRNKLKTEVLSCEHEFKTYKISIFYFFLTLIVAQILSSIVNIVCYFASGC